MHNKSGIRVRFAPSPTGNLHIGGLRTALFNWLFARHNDGKFLIRIEDTDRERFEPEYVIAINKGLQWADLEADEPTVTQSDFIRTHQQLIKKLLEEGKAYKCYCPPSMNDDAFKKYAQKCRIVDPTIKHGSPFVVRLKLPNKDSVTFDDLIRGPITFQMDQFDDFIIARSDGTPIYNFVVVCDDHAMGITQVIRGEDHISNTPKQILLYEALGFDVPQFAHLPLILNEAGGKLSKRDAATNVMEYKDQGFLPDALCNYLVRLGWAHGDQEIFTREELITLFTLEGVGKKGSIFDLQKLKWMNGMYMRAMSSEALLTYTQEELGVSFAKKFPQWSEEKVNGAITLFKERTETIQDMLLEIAAFYANSRKPSSEEVAQFCTPDTKIYLRELVSTLEALELFDAESIKKCLKDFTKEKNIKLVAIAQPIRLALLGKTASPGVFDLVALLGKQDAVSRINQFISFLGK